MKCLIISTCFFLLSVSQLVAADGGYNIKVKITGVKDTFCLLANYFGDKQYIKDTARADSKGFYHFKGKEKLPGGIYLIVLPSKKYFELMVDKEQEFSMETDTVDMIKSMKIKGSSENKLFYDYLTFIIQKQKEIEPLREKYKNIKSNKDSSELVQKKISHIDTEVKEYKSKFIKDHPDLFVSKVFKSMEEPVVPDAPKLANGKPDTLFPFKYYKAHYFDNIDFSDDRLLRTPIFNNKIKEYLDKLTLQHPDSINISLDYLCEKAKANKEIFKYLVAWSTYNYETSNIMGMDGVFVHLAQKYYMSKQAYWVDSTQLAKITLRANTLKNLLIDKKCPNITMADSNGNIYSLYNVKAPYTILYFWDHGCSHCKKTTPLLRDYYKKVASKGVQVFAVETETDVKEWKKYVRENELNWINVSDPTYQTGFKKTFDIYSTPVIYLLDDKKVIIAKRVDVDQLQGILDRKLDKK